MGSIVHVFAVDVKRDEDVTLQQIHLQPGIGLLAETMEPTVRELVEEGGGVLKEDDGVHLLDVAVAELLSS